MKRIYLIISVVVLALAIPIGVFFLRQRQDLRSLAAPATILSFNPTSITKQQGDIFSLDIIINTNDNTVSAAELIVNTDPDVVKVTGIIAGTFLSEILISGTNTDSSATITLGSPPTSPQQGTGTIATVTLEVIASSGTADVTLTGSQVAGIGEQDNVLSGMSPATITVSGSSEDPTPTPTTDPGSDNDPTSTPTPTTDPGSDNDPTSTPTPTTTINTDEVPVTGSYSNLYMVIGFIAVMFVVLGIAI
ncbi:cohesin domain-containing protein [Patescibacteria group bacterium]